MEKEYEYTKEQRLDFYQELFQQEEICQWEDGLCILLGKIACKAYFLAPWIWWKDLGEYFPEFKGLVEPKETEDIRKTRKEYVIKAIKTLNPNLTDNEKTIYQ